MAGVVIEEYSNKETGETKYKFRGIVGCYFLEGELRRGEGNAVLLKGRDVLLGLDVEDELVIFDDEIVGKYFYVKKGKNNSSWLNLRMSEESPEESRGLWK
jgi:hypothetical protein